jgi:hypothetical protein
MLINEINDMIKAFTAKIDEVEKSKSPSVNDTQEAAVDGFGIMKLERILQALEEA